MRPPRPEFRNKVQLDTSEDFFDREYGWVRRIDAPCPKCKHDHTVVYLEDQGFAGCTHCSYVRLLEGRQFVAGGYVEARKILESLLSETRVEKPFQARFIPMHFKRNGN